MPQVPTIQTQRSTWSEDFEVPKIQFTVVHTDVVGLLPMSNRFKYVLTAKRTYVILYLVAQPMENASAKSCADTVRREGLTTAVALTDQSQDKFCDCPVISAVNPVKKLSTFQTNHKKNPKSGDDLLMRHQRGNENKWREISSLEFAAKLRPSVPRNS